MFPESRAPGLAKGQAPLLQNSTYSHTSCGIVMTMGIVISNKELILKHAASPAWKRRKTGKEGHRGLCPTFPVCAGYRRHCWKHISKIIIYKNEGQNSRLETGSGRREVRAMGGRHGEKRERELPTCSLTADCDLGCPRATLSQPRACSVAQEPESPRLPSPCGTRGPVLWLNQAV